MKINVIEDHPSSDHYQPPDPTYEVVKCLEAHGIYGNGYRAQAIQYLLRADNKGGTRDLRAALWWIEREIRRREAELLPSDKAVTPDDEPTP